MWKLCPQYFPLLYINTYIHYKYKSSFSSLVQLPSFLFFSFCDVRELAMLFSWICQTRPSRRCYCLLFSISSRPPFLLYPLLAFVIALSTLYTCMLYVAFAIFSNIVLRALSLSLPLSSICPAYAVLLFSLRTFLLLLLNSFRRSSCIIIFHTSNCFLLMD